MGSILNLGIEKVLVLRPKAHPLGCEFFGMVRHFKLPSAKARVRCRRVFRSAEALLPLLKQRAATRKTQNLGG